MNKFAALGLTLLLIAPGAGVAAPPALPQPAHVVVVIEENHTLAQVVDSGHAPYLSGLAKQSALFTDAHGVTHPSLPNYFALFSGLENTNGDDCPAIGVPKTAPNLGSELLAAHRTFAAYSEALPSTGFTGCWAGSYARKHAPWVHFSNVPQSLHHPLKELPAFDQLPTVSFIVPDIDDDMHDGTVREGDDWANTHLAPLMRWAATHNTLVIVTWDEGYDDANSIPTLFIGPMVKAGRYSKRINHLNVLRTVEAMYGLPFSGKAAGVATITNVWR